MVWITLQACQVKWKKVNLTMVKVDKTYLMYIFHDNPNHREKVFKLETVQDIEKQQHLCQLLSRSRKYLAQFSVVRKKRHGGCTELLPGR